MINEFKQNEHFSTCRQETYASLHYQTMVDTLIFVKWMKQLKLEINIKNTTTHWSFDMNKHWPFSYTRVLPPGGHCCYCLGLCTISQISYLDGLGCSGRWPAPLKHTEKLVSQAPFGFVICCTISHYHIIFWIFSKENKSGKKVLW